MSRRICVITGGAGGIGYHLSEGFAARGYKVYALDLERKQELSPEIAFIEVDLRDENQIKDTFRKIVQREKNIHILINNAAIAHFNKSITESSAADFDAVLDVNLRGAYLCCKEFVKANRGEVYGRIINIASTRWHQNEADWEAYGASKGALVSLTNTLTVSLSDLPITVNAISPGWIQTEDYESLTELDHRQHPSGRVGFPRDILNGCLFLAHEENDFVNGVNLVIDGGMTKRMIYLD